MIKETLLGVDGGLARITLNRPQVLNALSPAQYSELDRTLAVWAEDDAVRTVLVDATEGRAFCAGGDIKAVWQIARDGGDPSGAFRDEYRMDRRIHRFPKPYISIMDGIVMGGGAGLSVNGRYRVATERTLFAMPETAIGFFPDVGAAHFLSRCPGRLGLYLGLTGARLNAADCLWAGLATHFVPSSERAALTAAIARAAAAADPDGAVAETLAAFHRDPGESALASHQTTIDRCFGHSAIRDVVSALVAEGTDWAWDTLEPIGDNSPTSLAVTFRYLSKAPALSFDEVIRTDFRLACHFLAGSDFHEGVRAQLVDKDKTPRWQPQSMGDLSAADVEAFFRPLENGDICFGEMDRGGTAGDG